LCLFLFFFQIRNFCSSPFQLLFLSEFNRLCWSYKIKLCLDNFFSRKKNILWFKEYIFGFLGQNVFVTLKMYRLNKEGICVI
jgi:hypothetical protein